ncbi:nucleotidyltransferase family protein [Actinomadura rubrisoli]|uniref:Nucleotidyltransferase family protein n=1 Tax=Actinomadura rubrisoli TaxID=2530368 RepID=A0A4R5BI10_9ACTN|nr:nucleotidyltransferase family protein [Actinomadura rubrisoli]TDD85023.1 hypothetical protein E1298_19120 [Actinomadura rubrisoli]
MGSADHYWDVVSVLGRLSPRDEDLQRAAAEMERLDPRALYTEIVRSRVYTIALRNLGGLAGRDDVAVVHAALKDLDGKETARRAQALPETRAVLRRVRDLDARVIKGLSLREHYADPELRHIGDLDLHVPDWESARQITRVLRERGWRWDTHEFPWIKWTDGGSLYGQLTMVLPDNEDPHSRVDLHIGPFSVGHSTLMPLVGWRPRDVLGVPSVVPCAESEIALIGAHAVNDGLLSMKDVNDAHVLLSRHAGVDWGAVEELCRGAGALKAMGEILSAAARVYPGTTVPAWAGDARRSGDTYLSTGEEPPGVRADRVRRLALDDERARGRDASLAERVAEEAYAYFTADLTPRLDAPVPAAPDGPHRRRDLCWRLLPKETWQGLADRAAPHAGAPGPTSDQELASGMRLVRSGKGTVVALDGEVFVPTVWGAVEPESTVLARALTGERIRR